MSSTLGVNMVSAIKSLLIVGLLLSLSSSFAGEFVRWTDETGTVHFSDSLENVPSKYRAQAKQEKFKEANVLRPSSAEGGRSSSDNRVLQSMLESWGEKPKLNTYEVPFEAYEGTAQRVIVSVTFNDSLTVPMAIDTGAPGLIISPQVAKKLGLFGRDEGMVVTAAGGLGGTVPAVRTFLDTVQVGGAKDTFIPATITPSVSRSFEGLIGMVFMSKYSFKIDSVKQLVVFEEVQPDPSSPGGRNERWWRGQFKELHALQAAWQNYASQTQRNSQQRDFAGRQVKEAEKLLSKLERYASQVGVPQNWR
jgi:predicted aspartyl protease